MEKREMVSKNDPRQTDLSLNKLETCANLTNTL